MSCAQRHSSEEDTKHVMQHAVQHVADVAETLAHRQTCDLIDHIGDPFVILSTEIASGNQSTLLAVAPLSCQATIHISCQMDPV